MIELYMLSGRELDSPLPLAGEHRPPWAAVLRQERRSEASALALEERGGWGKLSPLEQCESRRHPHPNPPPQAGEGARLRRGSNSIQSHQTLTGDRGPPRQAAGLRGYRGMRY